MSDFKCPMCTDCPDNCPLDSDSDTREYSADYYKGKSDGARDFAEWLFESKYREINVHSFSWYDDEGTDHIESLDKVLAEWQKGKENDK